VATTPKKTPGKGAKKAPTKKQLVARAKFAAMVKSGKFKKSASVKASKRTVRKREIRSGIPSLKIKPISKPAYAARTEISRDRKTPVIEKLGGEIRYSTVWM